MHVWHLPLEGNQVALGWALHDVLAKRLMSGSQGAAEPLLHASHSNIPA